MPSFDTVGSPLDDTADIIETAATDAFERLGNETRLAILIALWEATVATDHDPTATATLSFSALRNRVGIPQGTQFNYHLDKLVGTFVRKTDDGYQLHPAGEQLVHTVIATAGFDEPTLDTTPIDLECPNCGAPTALTYQHHRLYHVCTDCSGEHDLDDTHPDGVLEAWITNPSVLTHGSAEGIYAARKTAARFRYGLRLAGICPDCTGKVDARLIHCEDHPAEGVCSNCGRRSPVVAEFDCSVCHDKSIASVTDLIVKLAPPAVAAFYHEHGIELGYEPLDLKTRRQLMTLEDAAHEDLLSRDPLTVRVTLQYDGDEIAVTVDENLAIEPT